MSDVEAGVFDLDGCLSKGPRYRKELPLNGQTLRDELSNAEKFLDYMSHPKRSHIRRLAVTGRSLTITRFLIDLLMNELSVVEHGTMLYDPNDPNSARNLVDSDDCYGNIREAKDALEYFISNVAGSWDEHVNELAKQNGFTTKRMKDNLHILTYEIEPREIQNAEILKGILRRNVLPANVIEYIEQKLLKEMTSRDAYDLMPAVSKSEGLGAVIRIRGYNPENLIVVGDSYHSNGPMAQRVVEGKGRVICPANADDRLKAWVKEQGERGYIAEKPYFEGTMEGLKHFLGD